MNILQILLTSPAPGPKLFPWMSDFLKCLKECLPTVLEKGEELQQLVSWDLTDFRFPITNLHLITCHSWCLRVYARDRPVGYKYCKVMFLKAWIPYVK